MSFMRLTAPELPTELNIAFPFPRYLVDLDDHRMHVADTGPASEPGPTIVLFHGNPTWSFLWRKVIRRLTNHRVIAPDLIGCGLSDKPRNVSWHTPERHLHALVSLVDALELDRVVVVGQDWGGPIGMGVAAHLQSEGRLHGVVIGNTGVLSPRRPIRTTSFHRFSNLPGISDLAFRGLGFPLPILGRAQGDPASIGLLERRAYWFPFRKIADRAALLGLPRMVPSHDAHPSLPYLDRIGSWVQSYDGPAAIVWGHRDPILGRGFARHAKTWPHAEVTETQAGHFLQEEVPTEFANAVLSIAASGGG
ncbi:MAG: alpha/beta fold hydrolase [Myxococcota bacterium]